MGTKRIDEMAGDREKTYRAFISYSHLDGVICSKLYRRLDGYRVPRDLVGTPSGDGPVPDRLHPVFRDREEFATSADLSSSIQEALEQSDNLVVICSPAAAASKWVDAEIAHFVKLGRASSIHPVIVAGDPPDCFPPSLREALVEPLAADLRDDKDGLDDGALKTIAGLLGVPLGKLKDREAARTRKRAQRNGALAAIFAMLSVVAVATAWVAYSQSQRAQIAIRAGVEGLAGVADIVATESGTGGVRRSVGDALLRKMETLADNVIEIAPDNSLLAGERGRLMIISSRYHRTTGNLELAEREARAAETLYASLAAQGIKFLDAKRQQSAAFKRNRRQFAGARRNHTGAGGL